MSTKNKNNLAFTLAEVLITLGIIGVVAAMTIPTLMNKTNDSELKTAWKKAYSVFSQAFMQLQNDGGADWSAAGYPMRDSFTSYLKAIKVCDTAGDDCWHSAGKIKTLPKADGTQYTGGDFSGASGLVTPDGMKIIFNPDHSYSGWVMIDVNGDKKPNIMGKDIFGLRVHQEMNKTFPFPATEMGTCNPAAAGSAGNNFIGLGCSEYYLYN